jgi:hypothetical protein
MGKLRYRFNESFTNGAIAVAVVEVEGSIAGIRPDQVRSNLAAM